MNYPASTIINVAVGRQDGEYIKFTRREQAGPGTRQWVQVPDDHPNRFLSFREFSFYVGDSADFTEAATRCVRHICLNEKSAVNAATQALVDQTAQRARDQAKGEVSEELKALKEQFAALQQMLLDQHKAASQPVAVSASAVSTPVTMTEIPVPPVIAVPPIAPVPPVEPVAPRAKKPIGQDLNALANAKKPRTTEQEILRMAEECDYHRKGGTITRDRKGNIEFHVYGRIKKMHKEWSEEKARAEAALAPADLPAPQVGA